MDIGKLTFTPLDRAVELVAIPVATSLNDTPLSQHVYVARIDANLADTAAFCEEYNVGLDISTNCLIIEARWGEKTWYAACLVLANDSADINGIVRRHLNARKVSFAPMDTALQLTRMEYGGITPLGLPAEWPILIDESVMEQEVVVIGAGVRGAKVAVRTKIFHELPNTTVVQLKKG